MQVPPLDSSQYADLLDQIGASIRIPAAQPRAENVSRHHSALRSRALHQTLRVLAHAAAHRPR